MELEEQTKKVKKTKPKKSQKELQGKKSHYHLDVYMCVWVCVCVQDAGMCVFESVCVCVCVFVCVYVAGMCVFVYVCVFVCVGLGCRYVCV